MPKTKNYDPQLLESAVADVKSGKLSKKAAAVRYGVPRATIQFRLSGKFSKSSKGPPPVLSTEEENNLEEWILECSRKGFPRRKENVKLSVQVLLNKNKRQSVFTNNLPGDGWYRAFLKRHPKISLREPEAVTKASADFNEDICLATTAKLREPPLTATISYGQFKDVVGNVEIDRVLKGKATDTESNRLRNLIKSFKSNPEGTASPSVAGSDILPDRDQSDVISVSL